MFQRLPTDAGCRALNADSALVAVAFLNSAIVALVDVCVATFAASAVTLLGIAVATFAERPAALPAV